MAVKYKNLSVVLVLSVNILFFVIFFFGNCDYFRLLSRDEWNERNGILSDTFLYVLNSGSSINIYKINYENNGYPEKISASPHNIIGPFNSYLMRLAADPENKFLYATEYYSGRNSYIYGMAINNDGSLTDLPNFPYQTDLNNVQNITIDPLGRFLYISNCSVLNLKIQSYLIDNGSGALTKTGEYTLPNLYVSSSLNNMVIDETGKFLYTTYNLDPMGTQKMRLGVFLIDQTNGALKFIEENIYNTSNGNQADTLAIRVKSKRLYIGTYGSPNPLFVFNLNTNGSASSLSGSPFSFGPGCIIDEAKISPDQKVILSAKRQNYIASALLNEDGSITGYNELGCSNSPQKITTDPASKYAYILADNASGSGIIRAYKINNNGTIVEINGSPILNGYFISDILAINK